MVSLVGLSHEPPKLQASYWVWQISLLHMHAMSIIDGAITYGVYNNNSVQF